MNVGNPKALIFDQNLNKSQFQFSKAQYGNGQRMYKKFVTIQLNVIMLGNLKCI